MITFWAIYLIKVTLCLWLFSGLYWLAFRRRQFFQINRFYLLYTTILSFFIPLVQWTTSTPWVEDLTAAPIIADVITPIRDGSTMAFSYVYEPLQRTTYGFSITWGQLLLAIYLLGVTLCLGRMVMKLLRLRRIIRSSALSTVLDRQVLLHPEMPTSSFFSFLFWRESTDTPKTAWILAHEQVHARQWHSLDLLIFEFCHALQWYNPVFPALRRQISLVHEYIADRHVVSHLARARSYVQLLAETAAPRPFLPPVHTFGSQLHKRIRMITQEAGRTGSPPALRTVGSLGHGSGPCFLLPHLVVPAWH